MLRRCPPCSRPLTCALSLSVILFVCLGFGLFALFRTPDRPRPFIGEPVCSSLRDFPDTDDVVIPKRTFWVSDLHGGTTADLFSLLTYLGQDIVNGRFLGNRGPYPGVFTPNVEEVDRLAPFFDVHWTHFSNVVDSEVRQLFEFYKDDPQMAKVDAFVCMFPASMCEAFMPFNKTIIFLPANRHGMARCTPERFDRLHEHLHMLIDDNFAENSQRPYSVIASMSRYDQEEMRFYTGIEDIPYLPTSSFYYAGQGRTKYYAEGFTRPEILVVPLQLSAHPLMKSIRWAGGLRYTFAFAKSLYGFYELQDLANHRAAVLLPYATTSYGLTELYALGIPMFVPSVAFMTELIQEKEGVLMRDRPFTSIYVCDTKYDWSVYSGTTTSITPEKNGPENLQYWLPFSDFYVWPYVTQFDSWDHLVELLDNTNFRAIHKLMMMENERRERELILGWIDVLQRIETDRVIPNSYEEALSEIWGVTQLMVEEE